MQTARIIPFHRRNSAAEYKRRRDEALQTAWHWIMLPVYFVEALWLTATGRGKD